MTLVLQAFGGADSRCPKCGKGDAVTDWCAPGIVMEDNAALEVRAFSGEGRDLLRRECRNCSYAWYELPLDAPELEKTTDDPRDVEISALRRLILAIYNYAQHDPGLPANLRRAVAAVEETETGPAAEPEEDTAADIASASPYFAPLRKPGN